MEIIQPIYLQLRFGTELNKLYPEWYLHPGLKNLIYETRINTERRKEFTLEELFAELRELPSRNFVFIIELFELFRCLGTRLFDKNVVDKRSAMAIVRYFTPCLFTRPFRPGVTMTHEKRLYALVLFVIFNWPGIKTRLQTSISSHFDPDAIGKYYYLSKVKKSEEKRINKSTNSEEEILEEINLSTPVEDIETHRESITKEDAISVEKDVCYEDSGVGEKDFYNYREGGVIYFVENFTQTSFENVCVDQENLERSFERGIPEVEEKKMISSPYVYGHNESFKLRTPEVELPLPPPPPPCEIELIKFDKETSNSKIVQDQKVQTSITKQVIHQQKVRSSKLTKLKKVYKKESQIIVLHINPCQCKKKMKKTLKEKKSRKSSEEFQDCQDAPYYEEKDNFESPERNKNQQVHILDTPNFCCTYSMMPNFNNHFENRNDTSVQVEQVGWRAPSTFTENDYYYDIGNHTNPLNTSNPFYNPSINQPHKETLKERMAKIGWSYQDTSSSSPRSEIITDSPRLMDNYRIYFDSKNHSENDEKSREEDSKESNFIINLRKFGSKFNLFNKIKMPKFSRLSISAENLISDVKYKELPKRTSKSI